jgi:hypothetical protein
VHPGGTIGVTAAVATAVAAVAAAKEVLGGKDVGVVK